LVYDPNGVSSESSGYVTITTSAKKSGGGFSAKFLIGGRKYSLSGQFDATGAFSGTLGTWNINLLLDLHGGDRITGEITDGNWAASLLANRAIFGKTHPSPLAGTYTMILQAEDEAAGNGIGTLKVDSSGNVQWNLTLPDGAKSSSKTTLSKTGVWPLYATPYKSGGVIMGWMQYGSTADEGFNGQGFWAKPGAASSVYPNGLTNGVTVSGSRYHTSSSTLHMGSHWKVILNGGGLTTGVTNGVTMGAGNKIVPDANGASLKVKLNSASGLFQGTVSTSSGKGGSVPFQGVIFEKSKIGLGFFVGSDQERSGTVSLAPNP
jgi:hypothetical protein